MALIEKTTGGMWYDQARQMENQSNFPFAEKAYCKAHEAYSNALENDLTAEAWYNVGVSLYGLKKYNNSMTAYNKAIELDPNLADAWFNKGLALSQLKKYNDSVTAFNKATKLNPSDSEAWYNKGISLYYLSDYNNSIAAYDEAIGINPNYGDAWYNKGLSLARMGSYNDSLTAFETALMLNPDDEEISKIILALSLATILDN